MGKGWPARAIHGLLLKLPTRCYHEDVRYGASGSGMRAGRAGLTSHDAAGPKILQRLLTSAAAVPRDGVEYAE